MVKIIFTWNHSQLRRMDEDQVKAYAETQRYFEGESDIKVIERDGKEVKLEFWEDDKLIRRFLNAISLSNIKSIFKEYLDKYKESEWKPWKRRY